MIRLLIQKMPVRSRFPADDLPQETVSISTRSNKSRTARPPASREPGFPRRRFYRARIRRRSTYAVVTAAPAITTSRTQSQRPEFADTDWVVGPVGVPGFVPG